SGREGIKEGDVDLIAPKGTEKAGDAGIRAGNLNIAALQVLNAANIQATGQISGAPVEDTSALPAGVAGKTRTDTRGREATSERATRSADAQKAADAVRQALARLGLISVEVLGLGR